MTLLSDIPPVHLRFGIGSSASWTGRWKSLCSLCSKQIVGSHATELGGKEMCACVRACVLHYMWSSWFCVPGRGQIGKAVRLPQLHVQRLLAGHRLSCPPTRAYCLAKWELHFFNKVTGKQEGKRNGVTCLNPRSREDTCVELVCGRGGEWMLQSPKQSTVLSSVVWTRSGRRMCLWETETPRLNACLFFFFLDFIFLLRSQGKCLPLVVKGIHFCPSRSEPNTYLW